MAARILEVCDAVADRLRADNPGLAVERVYVADLDPPPAARTVYVFPLGFGQQDGGTRGEDVTDYRVGVVAVCRSPVVPPAADWVDAELTFVVESVFNPLQDARDGAAALDGGRLVPQAAEVVSAFDPEQIAAGVFFADVSITYREYA